MARRVGRRVTSSRDAGRYAQPSLPGLESFGDQMQNATGRRTVKTTRPRGAIDYASGKTAQDEADRTISYETALAIQEAKDGDDSALLPYRPTPSINPPRPRTQAAGYDPRTQTLRIKFRNGEGYEYYGVPPRVWRNFKRVKSPGRAVNRVLNQYPYAKASWGER